jgi:type I restriction enzyme S subunit
MVRPRGSTCGTFVKRLFDSFYAKARFAVAANGLTRVGLGQYALDNVEMPFPPPEEQQAIATFLDRETAKIDALVEAQKRLIELLKEKRQAVISQAVTKGLDPNVPMKDSGVEWLGEVPEHWIAVRLKHVASSIIDCPHETPVYDSDGKFAVIRTADISDGVLDLSNAFRLGETEYELRTRRGRLLTGDIVYSREGERWGHAALVPHAPVCCLGQRMMQIRSSNTMNPEFLMWALNSEPVYRQGQIDTVGATSPHVNVETIRNFALTMPPVAEQTQIANFIGNACRTFASTRKSTSRTRSAPTSRPPAGCTTPAMRPLRPRAGAVRR